MDVAITFGYDDGQESRQPVRMLRVTLKSLSRRCVSCGTLLGAISGASTATACRLNGGQRMRKGIREKIIYSDVHEREINMHDLVQLGGEILSEFCSLLREI